MTRIWLIIFLLASFSANLQAQKENNNWYTGYYNHINFNSGAPVYSYTKRFLGATASISSRTTGQTLFYTSGFQVFDRRDSIMQNGDTLIGAGLFLNPGNLGLYGNQGAVIVPFANDTTLFYVFHAQTIFSSLGGYPAPNQNVYYSIVDMKLNGGYGGVIVGQKNILLANTVSDMMCVLASDHCTRYLLLHHRNLNQFQTYEITPAGISAPIISTHPSIELFPGYIGPLIDAKTNSDYTKLYVGSSKYALIYGFNRSSGIVSNQRIIDSLTPGNTWNTLLEWGNFSPDGNKILGFTNYAGDTASRTRLFYYDLTQPWPGGNNRIFIGYSPRVYHMNLAPDRSTLLVSYNNLIKYVGKINSPNSTGAACNYDTMAIAPNPDYRAHSVGRLPDLIVYPTHDTIYKSINTALCLNDTIPARLYGNANGTAYKWNNSTTASSIIVNAAGTYWVRSTTPCNVVVDTFHVTARLDTMYHRMDTNICSYSVPVILRGPKQASSYQWQDNTTDSFKIISGPGTYWVRSLKNCTLYIDTFRITAIHDTISATMDTGICFSIPIILSGFPGAENYRWNNGSTTLSIPASYAGKFWVQSKKGCKIFADTFKVSNTNFSIELGSDTMICEGKSIKLNTNVPGASYRWQDGTTTPDYVIKNSGTFSVAVTLNGCTRQDTIGVEVYHPSVFLGADTMLCPGTSLLLAAGNDSASYKWQDGSIGSTFNVTAAGEYNVTITRRGCLAKDTITVDYYQTFLNITPDTLICEGDMINLQASAIAGSQYTWSNGEKTPMIRVGDQGIYKVEVEDVCGILTDSVAVTTHLCNCKLVVPNAFTPNNDGLNDVIRAHVDCDFKKFEFAIFNRYGQKLFFTYNRNQGWDGTYNGIPVDLGVYFYYIRVTGPNDKTYMEKGDLTLLR